MYFFFQLAYLLLGSASFSILAQKAIFTTIISTFQVTTVEQRILNLFFFPASLEEWFHLDPSVRNSETINAFKQKLLPFIRPFVRQKTVFSKSLAQKD